MGVKTSFCLVYELWTFNALIPVLYSNQLRYDNTMSSLFVEGCFLPTRAGLERTRICRHILARIEYRALGQDAYGIFRSASTGLWSDQGRGIFLHCKTGRRGSARM